MADTFIQLPADSTGKKVDTRTEATNAEHREVHVIGDPSTNEGVAVVSNVDITGERYGLVVREANSSAIVAGLSTVTITGLPATTVVIGDIPSDVADTGTAPVKQGGVARTTNPSLVADGDRITFSGDALGRQVMRPLQVRGLLTTAYATLSTGTETTLLASGASTFNDLIYIMGANTSGTAVQVDVRDGTAGGVLMTLEIPGTATQGVSLPIPIPQNVAAQTWTVDMADITGTTVYISALFSKEV